MTFDGHWSLTKISKSDLYQNILDATVRFLNASRDQDARNNAVIFFILNANVWVFKMVTYFHFGCHGSYIWFAVVKPRRILLFCIACFMIIYCAFSGVIGFLVGQPSSLFLHF